jgi:hypothetical protein
LTVACAALPTSMATDFAFFQTTPLFYQNQQRTGSEFGGTREH